jgi:hypothetical protein
MIISASSWRLAGDRTSAAAVAADDFRIVRRLTGKAFMMFLPGGF